ncbi:MAG: nucleotide pyrophosphohydrolase [Desulfitobacteriaceae bacterium]|nr:nucleotide pyrophosphohydrolase [Desulfitobacteriaceae bacterium]MDI6915310.1 nucleotide pyrophosphohydrolase [Desulfitobacteriaceae bacterium]
MDIKDWQQEVDDWISQFEEGYWQPSSMMLRLIEEVGELAREVNHQFGEKPKKPSEPEGDLALEMADILFIIIAMSNSLNIDLEDAFARMLAKYRERDSERWTRKSKSEAGGPKSEN